MKTIVITLFTFIFYTVCDFIWLMYIARRIYLESIGEFMRTSSGFDSHFISAVLVYVLISLGIVLFVLSKSAGQYTGSLIWGAIYGLIVYGIYDFTNYAVFKNWPLNITLIDLAWGIFLCAMTSLFATFIAHRFR